MKNTQKGFIVPLLLAIIAVLLIGGGAYVYTQNKQADQPATASSYENKLVACDSFTNNSIKQVAETSRLFIRLPKDIYPYVKDNVQIRTVNGNAAMGYVSNGGLPGQGLNSTPECWSTYYEFSGNGEVDLTVKSASAGISDYFIRFLVGQNGQATSATQTANWKTYTNVAFGFSIMLPSNTNVYTCEDNPSRPTVANEKNYRVFILENPSDNLMKSCDYSEREKYNNLYINASRSDPGAYSDLVAYWKKVYGDGKYVTLAETTFAGHNALIKTKVEGPNNDDSYKEVVIDGGTYSYDLSFAKKSDT